jgi:hypothetical protein
MSHDSPSSMVHEPNNGGGGPSLGRNIYSVTFRGAFGNEPLRLRVERAGAPDQSHKLKRRCM